MSNWYNENANRDYPFQTRRLPLDSSLDIDLPKSLIVECGIVVYPHVEYDDAIHSVYLARIRRQDDTLYIELATTALPDNVLIFSRNIAAAEYVTEIHTTMHASSSSSSAAGGACDAEMWSGFLVTGDLSAILEVVADGEEVTFRSDLWVLEPSRIHNLKNAYVQSISLANVDRTRVSGDGECGEEQSSAGESPIYVNAYCMQGDLAMAEGYNCAIQQDDAANAITIGAARGRGAGEPCEEIPIYVGEVSPDGGRFLSGGPACSEVVSGISGSSARNLQIVAGRGFRVAAGVSPHTLDVELDLSAFTICEP